MDLDVNTELKSRRSKARKGSLLHNATSAAQVKLLLERKADINGFVRIAPVDGKDEETCIQASPLHAAVLRWKNQAYDLASAAKKGKEAPRILGVGFDLFQALVQAKADVNATIPEAMPSTLSKAYAGKTAWELGCVPLECVTKTRHELLTEYQAPASVRFRAWKQELTSSLARPEHSGSLGRAHFNSTVWYKGIGKCLAVLRPTKGIREDNLCPNVHNQMYTSSKYDKLVPFPEAVEKITVSDFKDLYGDIIAGKMNEIFAKHNDSKGSMYADAVQTMSS